MFQFKYLSVNGFQQVLEAIRKKYKFKCDQDLKEVLAVPTFFRTASFKFKSERKLRHHKNSFFSQSSSFDTLDSSLSDDEYLIQKIKEEVDSDYQNKSEKSFELQDGEEESFCSKGDSFFDNFYFNLLTNEIKSN